MSIVLNLSKKELLEGLSRSMSRKYKLRLKEHSENTVRVSVNDSGKWDELKDITLEIAKNDD